MEKQEILKNLKKLTHLLDMDKEGIDILDMDKEGIAKMYKEKYQQEINADDAYSYMIGFAVGRIKRYLKNRTGGSMKTYSEVELNLKNAKADFEWVRLDIELALHAKRRGENGNVISIPIQSEEVAVRNDIIRNETDKLIRKVLSLLVMVSAMEWVLDGVAKEYNLDIAVLKNDIINRYIEIGKNAGIDLE